MSWLHHWFIECYLNPARNSYSFVQVINHYTYRVILSIFILTIFFPTLKLSLVYYQNHQTQIHLAEEKEVLVNKQKLFKSIEQHQINQYQKSQQFTDFDLKIKVILQENNVEIEYLQWYFDPYKRIDIGLNGQSIAIFNVLNKLHQLNSLFAQDINIVKLYQDRKVQMNASFVIQDQENKQ